jgi:hypothetical protein
VDIETGEVLFEWHSLEHVGFEESTAGPNPDQRDAYDYFQINSVAEDNVGNLLVGARKTSAIYKVDRESGEVIWRLGGNRSNFVMGEGARFAFQHDARRHMLWCWIYIRDRECSAVPVELDRTTHVSCMALLSPVSGVATPRPRPSRRR